MIKAVGEWCNFYKSVVKCLKLDNRYLWTLDDSLLALIKSIRNILLSILCILPFVRVRHRDGRHLLQRHHHGLRVRRAGARRVRQQGATRPAPPWIKLTPTTRLNEPTRSRTRPTPIFLNFPLYIHLVHPISYHHLRVNKVIAK